MRRRITASDRYVNDRAWNELIRLGDVAAEAILDFQDAVSGPPEYSNWLSYEDIETLDRAYEILKSVKDAY